MPLSVKRMRLEMIIKERRIMLGDLLKIGYYNAKQLLKALNSFNISREQFEEAVKKINEKDM